MATDISRFVFIYLIFLAAFYLSIETINGPYARFYRAAQSNSSLLSDDCEWENGYLEGTINQLFALGFGDSTADVLKSVSTDVGENCVKLQVVSNTFHLNILIYCVAVVCTDSQ